MIKINSNRINYDEIIKSIVSSLRENIKMLINKSKFDRTFKAIVIGNIKGNKYQVLYKGEKYTVTSDVTLVTDQIVRVCAPQNNWSELFVVTNTTSSDDENEPPTVNYVSGVKGESETAYRTGQVNITKANLGLSNAILSNNPTISNVLRDSRLDSANTQIANVNGSSKIMYLGNPNTIDDLRFETSVTGSVSMTNITFKKISVYNISSATIPANNFYSETLPSEYQNATFYIVRPLQWAHFIFGDVESSNSLYVMNISDADKTIPLRIICIWMW